MNQFTLLGTRRFAPLFATQFLGAFNDNIFKNALVIFIAFTLADRTGANSSILVVTAAGLFILPFFLFSAFAGQLADKFEKSMLIRRIKIAEIVIMLFAAVGFIQLDLVLLMIVLFFMGAQSTMFGPLKYGILPQHLGVTELIGGNGMIQMGTFLAILTGTILGGVLIAVKPSGPWFVSAVVLTVAVCGWLASCRIPKAAPPEASLRINWNFAGETVRIIGYARENLTVFWSIIAISWFWFYGATFLSLVPSYTRDVLAGNEHITTMLLAAFTVGIATGSLLCERLSGRRVEMGLVPMGAAGLFLFAFDLYLVGVPEVELPAGAVSLTAPLFLRHFENWRILFDLIMIGLFGGLYIVPLYALVQSRCTPMRRARIIASNNILNALFMVISALMTIGLLAAGATIPSIFLVVALLHVAITLGVFTIIPEFKQRALALVKR